MTSQAGGCGGRVRAAEPRSMPRARERGDGSMDFREVGNASQQLGPVGRRGRTGHGQPDHARADRGRQPARQAGGDLRPRHPVRRQRSAARRRPHQPGAADVGDGPAAGVPRCRSTTPTTTCSCRCSRRRSGTAWRTCSTTTRCTTGSRRATSARTGRCTARSTRWPRASSAAGCCSTSPGSRASTGCRRERSSRRTTSTQRPRAPGRRGRRGDILLLPHRVALEVQGRGRRGRVHGR